jgi:hypothetical protein
MANLIMTFQPFNKNMFQILLTVCVGSCSEKSVINQLAAKYMTSISIYRRYL